LEKKTMKIAKIKKKKKKKKTRVLSNLLIFAGYFCTRDF